MFRTSLSPSSGALSTALAASVFRINAEEDVFPAVSTTAGNTSTSAFIRKPEAATAVQRAPGDGRNDDRNMLSSAYANKQ
jgi:hypothetical protein